MLHPTTFSSGAEQLVPNAYNFNFYYYIPNSSSIRNIIINDFKTNFSEEFYIIIIHNFKINFSEEIDIIIVTLDEMVHGAQ